MDKETLKQNFLLNLNDEITSKLRPEHYAILDETIESILDGKDTINGHHPVTDRDFFIVIGYGLITRIKLFSAMLKPLLSSLDQTEVNINYRGQSFNYKSFK